MFYSTHMTSYGMLSHLSLATPCAPVYEYWINAVYTEGVIRCDVGGRASIFIGMFHGYLVMLVRLSIFILWLEVAQHKVSNSEVMDEFLAR